MLPQLLTILIIMLLTELQKYINVNKIYNLTKKKINFNHIYTNSKIVKKFSIFAIDYKKNFKYSYLEEAKKSGSVAIITNRYFKNCKLPQFVVTDINLVVAKLLNQLFPFRPLKSVAITGTNGKTSVVWYISQIFINNNLPVKSYGTLGYYINGKKINNSTLTTPNYEVLHQSAFLKKKNDYNFIFEASSHAIDQNRLKDFTIDVAAITNISHDHLDYHKNFQNYKKVKLKLFTNYLHKNGYAVLNDKIKGISDIKKKLISINHIITYGKINSDISLIYKKNKIQAKIFKKKFLLNLIHYSKIELENIACAVACCVSLKMSTKDILKGLQNMFNPPGRLEKILNIYNFNVYVDYAHTPNALKQILVSQTIKNKKPHVVFGCGGNRDKEKRSKMGVIANRYAERVYITDDNPRDENPALIRKSILINCKKGIEIANRKEAIKTAINNLKKNDILIIAGKGHEKFQINKNKLKFFDDVIVAKDILKKKSNK